MHHLIALPRCIEGCCAYTVTWGACTCLSVYGESHVRGTLYARPIDPPLYFPRGVYSVRTHVSGQPSWKARSVRESYARRRPAVLAIYVQFTPAREVRYIHVFFFSYRNGQRLECTVRTSSAFNGSRCSFSTWLISEKFCALTFRTGLGSISQIL